MLCDAKWFAADSSFGVIHAIFCTCGTFGVEGKDPKLLAGLFQIHVREYGEYLETQAQINQAGDRLLELLDLTKPIKPGKKRSLELP